MPALRSERLAHTDARALRRRRDRSVRRRRHDRSGIGFQRAGAGPAILIDIASVVALVAGALAAQNGAPRMLFALGRDGRLPRQLSRTLRRFGTPVVALTTLLAASIAVGLGFGLVSDPCRPSRC